MHRASLFLFLTFSLWSLEAAGAQRKLTLKTFDGRVISGLVVLETERSLLLRTEQGYSRPSAQLFGGIDSQLRLHFTERFGIGMGLVLGVTASYQSSFGTLVAAFALGPTLTVAAVRLGAGLNHELSLSGSMIFAAGASNFAFAGGLGVLKYAFLF